MDTINKALSFNYFWAWCIPLAVLGTVFGPNTLNEFEVATNWILIVCWWGAYPYLGVKKLQKLWSDTRPWTLAGAQVVYWSVFAALLREAIVYFIKL